MLKTLFMTGSKASAPNAAGILAQDEHASTQRPDTAADSIRRQWIPEPTHSETTQFFADDPEAGAPVAGEEPAPSESSTCLRRVPANFAKGAQDVSA